MADKVLYGDDKLQNREAFARVLKLRGLEVDLATNPEELLRKARANSYRVIVTDLEYTPGGREGYGVLKQLRDLPVLKVLYSGVGGFEYAAEAYESGADFAVLNKNQSALLEILDKELNSGEENER